jgi:hypothetical protein
MLIAEPLGTTDHPGARSGEIQPTPVEREIQADLDSNFR